MIWVVSPMLHDTEAYLRVCTEVRAAVAAAGDTRALRFLVVDDSAGTDPDVSRLAVHDDVEVLTPPFNLGHQRAIVHGLRHLAPRLADDDVVITMDSDGEVNVTRNPGHGVMCDSALRGCGATCQRTRLG